MYLRRCQGCGGPNSDQHRLICFVCRQKGIKPRPVKPKVYAQPKSTNEPHVCQRCGIELEGHRGKRHCEACAEIVRVEGHQRRYARLKAKRLAAKAGRTGTGTVAATETVPAP